MYIIAESSPVDGSRLSSQPILTGGLRSLLPLLFFSLPSILQSLPQLQSFLRFLSFRNKQPNPFITHSILSTAYHHRQTRHSVPSHTMTCIRVRSRLSNISDKCLRTLRLKSKPKRNIQIVSTYYLVSISADSILYSLRLSTSNPALWSTSQATARMSKYSPSRLFPISLTSIQHFTHERESYCIDSDCRKRRL